MVTCGDCGRAYPRQSKSGPVPVRCPDCKREHQRQYARQYREFHRDRLRQQITDCYRRREYGIGTEDFEAMLASQNGRCAICDTDQPGGFGGWHIDHCHTTSKVRGLLCQKCNMGLGHFDDDADRLLAAAAYLKGVAP